MTGLVDKSTPLLKENLKYSACQIVNALFEDQLSLTSSRTLPLMVFFMDVSRYRPTFTRFRQIGLEAALGWQNLCLRPVLDH